MLALGSRSEEKESIRLRCPIISGDHVMNVQLSMADCHIPAVVDVVLVGDSDHLTLVSHEPYRPPDIRGDGALEAALPQEAVNGLGLVPALREWHFRQKGGSLPVPALAEPLYPDAVSAELPVCPVRPVLEVAEDGYRHVQVGQLVSCNGTEPKQKKSLLKSE